MTSLAMLAFWLMRSYRRSVESTRTRYRGFVIQKVEGTGWVIQSPLGPGSALAICSSRDAAEHFVDDMHAGVRQ